PVSGFLVTMSGKRVHRLGALGRPLASAWTNLLAIHIGTAAPEARAISPHQRVISFSAPPQVAPVIPAAIAAVPPIRAGVMIAPPRRDMIDACSVRMPVTFFAFRSFSISRVQQPEPL